MHKTNSLILTTIIFICSMTQSACDSSKTEGAMRESGIHSAQETERAEVIYQERCSMCHGDSGMGGVGKALDSPHLAEMSDGQLFMMISQGIGDRMPGFQDVLSSDEIAELINWIRSLQSESTE